MTNREKVIKGLECHLARRTDGMINGALHNCLNCPFKAAMNCTTQVMTNALILLKFRRGKWKERGLMKIGYECSECGRASICMSDYCPNCGARMEVENETD